MTRERTPPVDAVGAEVDRLLTALNETRRRVMENQTTTCARRRRFGTQRWGDRVMQGGIRRPLVTRASAGTAARTIRAEVAHASRAQVDRATTNLWSAASALDCVGAPVRTSRAWWRARLVGW